MESDNQSQESVTLGKRPLLDETTKSVTSEKKQRWMEKEETVAGSSHDSYLTHSESDMTSIQENRTQDTWLQEIRESQGNCEQEVTSGDEANMYTYYNTCKKNPGHVQFIDVNTFRSEHLPERYQSYQTFIDLVRAQADVTCLIKVSYVSPDRPGTSPFYRYRGRRDFIRSGTGWVCQVIVHTEEDKRKSGYYPPCQCQTCQRSDEPRSDWAEVMIRTANHVVFDTSEAEACKCYFFYDNPQQNLMDCPVLTAPHVQQVYSYSDGDASDIVYYIHDLVLARKLKDICDLYGSLCVDLRRKYATISHVVTARDAKEKDDDKNKDDNTQVQLPSDKNNGDTGHGVQGHLCQDGDCHLENSDDKEVASERHDGDKKDDLVIITSHPHGCSKMVTLGQLIYIHHMDSILTWYEYSTATCPGSSGAPVFVLGRMPGSISHPHSGNVRGQRSLQVNRSGAS